VPLATQCAKETDELVSIYPQQMLRRVLIWYLRPSKSQAYTCVQKKEMMERKDKQTGYLERRRLLLTDRLDLSLSDGLVRNSADYVIHSRCILPAEVRRVQERHPVLSLHAVGSDSLRVVAHEHVGEVATIVDALSGLLTGLEARKRLHDRGEVGLVEVGEGEALAGVEADFVGC